MEQALIAVYIEADKDLQKIAVFPPKFHSSTVAAVVPLQCSQISRHIKLVGGVTWNSS